MKNKKDKIKDVFTDIYGDGDLPLLDRFLEELDLFVKKNDLQPLPPQWYKNVSVYSLYVDLFNRDFKGLESKLGYLKDLGISCLWLLPILDSPGRDAGFDISDYKKIRKELLGQGGDDRVFTDFVSEAHRQGIKVLFDIAVNHTSDEHPWFKKALKSKDSPFRDYYIWSKSREKYKDARIIFEGIEESNWKKAGDEYYFHRFFDFQPDLNYRNPRVILEMSRVFLFWLAKGVDGFRVDAIPYLWKEEGTGCENLGGTHKIIKFFRSVTDYVRPGTLLLAEACQKPHEVVKYFNTGDECHAGYHFPLMPQIFKALKMQKAFPVLDVLSEEITPSIPSDAQWFTFLRCHDELSLELVYVSEADRKFIHESYCKQPLWDFRQGQGISARLAELLDRNPERISLAFSIMLTLPGTPVIYYGDEFAKLNDIDFYREQTALTGKDDTRFLVRGRIDWDKVEKELSDGGSLGFKVFSALKLMLVTRANTRVFANGEFKPLTLTDDKNNRAEEVLAFMRIFAGEKFLLIHNLKGSDIKIDLSPLGGVGKYEILIGETEVNDDVLKLSPFSYLWLKAK